MTNTIIINLVNDILRDDYFKRLYEKISLNYGKHEIYGVSSNQLRLENKEFFDLMRYADILSCSDEYPARNKAFHIISLLFPCYQNDEIFQRFSKAVLLKLGNFPSVKLLKKNEKKFIEMPFERLLERSWKEDVQAIPHKKGYFFTDAQYHLFKKISHSKCFSFSGPTSMGKSFIIRAFLHKIIGNKPPENIVIIVPTRALINQFSMDLKKDLGRTLYERNYRISTNSNISDYLEIGNVNYILVLTPERLLSYLSRPKNPSLGFLFIDEAHKLTSENDIRSVVAYNAIEKVLKKHPNIKLYFSSPYISNPEIFLKAFSLCSRVFDINKIHITQESPVAQNRFFVDLCQQDVNIWQYINDIPILLNGSRLSDVNDCIDFVLKVGRNKNNILYCYSKKATLDYALRAYTKLSGKHNNVISPVVTKAIRQIKSYIHKDFYLAKFLEKGVAYHYGNLPQIIRNIVEKLYREEEIQYLFCTSTLLEGVNLPAKNIFILRKGKGRKGKIKPIDFKNLAGRAGRLGIELSGNVFCIRHSDNEWNKNDIIQDKDEITLELSVKSRIDNNLRKIRSIIINKDISGTEVEKKILKYIANIICLDTMTIESNYISPVIDQLIRKNKKEIIDLAKQKTRTIDTPLEILESNGSIDLIIQSKLYEIVQRKKERLPAKVDYINCLDWLEKFYMFYKWEENERQLKNKESLKYFATLMNQWINGISLSQIISESINYYHKYKKKIQIEWNMFIPFDKNKSMHINILVNQIIDNIEHKLRFIFEKYFDHYHRNLISVFGEEKAGPNWALYLEYGTKNTIVIALQNLGLSRHSASLIYRKHSDCLKVVNGKLKDIDRAKLITRFSKDSLEYDGIVTFL